MYLNSDKKRLVMIARVLSIVHMNKSYGKLTMMKNNYSNSAAKHTVRVSTAV